MDERILVSDSIAQEGIALLAQGASVDVRTGLSPAELLAAIPDYEALVVRSQTKVTGEVIRAGTRLRVVARAGVGVDNIDVEAATERGVVVVNAPTGNTVSAAELAVVLLLALARHIPAADSSLRRGEWERKNFLGVEVRGKTAGLVGLGKVGSAVARRLRAMEMQVLAFDPYVPDERARMMGVDLTDLESLLRRSDFVSLHTALTDETYNLIGREQLALMKPESRIINTARGGLIDEAALLEALEAGKLAGAALDVFEQEPPSNAALLANPRVVVTPHLGASTMEAQEQVAVDVAREVRLVLDGQPATAAVNAPFVDPETLEVVGPYLEVARMCGTLATQLTSGQWQSVRIRYDGEIAEHDVTTLKAATVAGLLATISEEHVNLVSVNNIIAHRGWQVTEEKRPEAEEYANLITVRLMTSGGEVSVAGTLGHGRAHIVDINGARVDVARDDHSNDGHTDGEADARADGRAEGHSHILLLENEDRPGRIGAVGSELGDLGVNISSMDVGRQDRGKALMVLTIGRALQPAEVQRIAAIAGIERVVQAKI